MSNCPYCCWIDPTRLEADEVDGPRNYCRVCAKDLRVPETVHETGQEAQDERD